MTGFFAISSIVFGNHGAGGRTRTGTPSLAVDFESTTSTNSITPALLSVIIQHGARKFKKKLPEAALFLRFHLLVEVFAEQGERGSHVFVLDEDMVWHVQVLGRKIPDGEDAVADEQPT